MQEKSDVSLATCAVLLRAQVASVLKIVKQNVCRKIKKQSLAFLRQKKNSLN